MKKHITLTLALALFAFIVVSSLRVNSFSGNPPAVLANIVEDAPGSNCNTCHGTGQAGSIPETGGITFTISADDTYVLDSTYDVTVKVDNPGKRNGFQIIALDKDNNSVGTIVTVSANSQTKNGGSKSVTHLTHQNLPSETNGEVDFKWTAPSTDVGDVTFYAIMVAADGNNGTSNDDVYYASSTISASQTASLQFNLKTAWTVYPTITNNNVYIETETNNTLKKVAVYNITGDLVYEAAISPNDNKILSFQDFPAQNGWYILVLKGEETHVSKRVFYQK
jgi:hypothetical protein